ncbi:MASE1 domain-containing protein [Xanthomonas hydrangeae]|uniref:MASE1 domain-containing protein n=1 Tax=Xanthomonas hydrangeae TaxID=2775159 RepID=A0AAU0BAW2_9XANT|nr:MASE1 domain-containing protein [Xanthomonas hydrangeae]WOB49126.1 MASE1 domain-containing protein [Xanthomonas hydrangeae]
MDLARQLAKGLLISTCYCLAFVMLWFTSIDQWYLPVGLRVVALLFRPYREWPFLLAGDAAAMLWLRIPLGEMQGFDPIWSYLSPFLHSPLIACAIGLLRFYAPDIVKSNQWLIPAAAAIGLWNALCSVLLNWSLGGPPVNPFFELLLRYWSGSYLGMLVLLLPMMLWSNWKNGPVRPDLSRDLGLSVTGILSLFFMLSVVDDQVFRNVLMLGMMVPMVVLTFRHGWRGAALGSLLASLSLEFSLPRIYQLGFFDRSVFNMQLLHALITTVLFIFNARLREKAPSDAATGAKVESLVLARASYLGAERMLRNRVIEYSDINVQINRMRKDIIADLRAKGQNALAMEMTRVGVIESQLLQQYVAALYPLEIETHGLFRALQSSALERFCNSQLQSVLRGDCRALSLGLQLAAYRCVLNSVELLPEASKHFIQARAWIGKRSRGVVIRVIADASLIESSRRESLDAEAELKTRLKSHGGMFRRRHALVLTFFVTEPCSTTSTEIPSSVGQWLLAGRAL